MVYCSELYYRTGQYRDEERVESGEWREQRPFTKWDVKLVNG
jgi:hypothetical protein